VREGKDLDGWDMDYFLAKALTWPSYGSLREVMSDPDMRLDAQG
jgi:hypothetical protein